MHFASGNFLQFELELTNGPTDLQWSAVATTVTTTDQKPHLPSTCIYIQAILVKQQTTTPCCIKFMAHLHIHADLYMFNGLSACAYAT